MYMSHQSFVSILLHQISNIVILIFCLKISFIYSYLYYQFSASSLFKSLVLVKKCMTFYKLMKSINNSISNPVRCNLASVRKICLTPCTPQGGRQYRPTFKQQYIESGQGKHSLHQYVFKEYLISYLIISKSIDLHLWFPSY